MLAQPAPGAARQGSWLGLPHRGKMVTMVEHVAEVDAIDPPTGRYWGGRPLSPLVEAQMFFEDQGPVPETYRRLRDLLDQEGIPYIVIGALAVNAHGFVRATRDIDICMRAEDLRRFKQTLVGTAFLPVEGRPRRFTEVRTRTTVDILVSGQIAGRRDRNREIRFPDPAEAEVHNSARTVSLARLIELKLVTWRFQDWGDVVNLIRHFDLDQTFAERLHPTVRSVFLQCYDQCLEEDKYHPELDDT
jgi:hypothetical protein